MEKGPSFQSICGRNVLLPVNGYQHKLVSKGNAGGNCFSTLVVGLTSKLTCKICVDLEEQANWNLRADIMNITFTGEAENVRLTYNAVVKNIKPIAHNPFQTLYMLDSCQLI